MPVLSNPKHEEFAKLLAKGVKQGAAYIQAGYTENKGAASRLAQSSKVQDRVEEYQKEIKTKISTAMTVPTDENWETLKDMGLTYQWVAQQYKLIYEEAMDIGSLPAANTAVANIQKLIEMEAKGANDEGAEKDNAVNMTAMLGVLDKVGDIIKTVKDQPAQEPQYIDVTPKEGDQ